MYEYWPARAVEIHDGDTLWMEVDLGLDVVRRCWVRLAECYAPELNEPGGVYARDALAEYCKGNVFRMRTYRLRRSDKEKMSFIRYVAHLNVLDVDETVSAWLVRVGLATRVPVG